MYKFVIRRKIHSAFAALSVGDAPSMLTAMHPQVHHTFPGDHALGGERSDRDDVAAWFERLFRLFPGLRFDIRALAVDGSPLNTVIGVEWTNTATLLDGSSYTNTGAHILRVRRGKIVSFHAYLHDGEAFSAALARLSAHGLAEADAPAIVTVQS